jgi:hypothetical protein
MPSSLFDPSERLRLPMDITSGGRHREGINHAKERARFDPHDRASVRLSYTRPVSARK